ncbi:MAG: MOSC domain-containing protein [Paracoccaceae bacterium]
MTAQLAHIFRHPIKAHGREELASVLLSAGACLPFDRHWAVAHEAARLSPGTWGPCANFSRGAKAPALMAIAARLDEPTRSVTLTHPDRPAITIRPDDPADLAPLLSWLAPLVPADRAKPASLHSADRGLTDTDFASVSILALASNRALGQRMGHALSIHRWRGNLWIEGTAPFEEFDWVGRRLRIGAAELEVVEPITRCKATTANPDTGRVDADTLGALNTLYGHQDFGVYARVLGGGMIATGDRLELLP